MKNTKFEEPFIELIFFLKKYFYAVGVVQ